MGIVLLILINKTDFHTEGVGFSFFITHIKSTIFNLNPIIAKTGENAWNNPVFDVRNRDVQDAAEIDSRIEIPRNADGENAAICYAHRLKIQFSTRLKRLDWEWKGAGKYFQSIRINIFKNQSGSKKSLFITALPIKNKRIFDAEEAIKTRRHVESTAFVLVFQIIYFVIEIKFDEFAVV